MVKQGNGKSSLGVGSHTPHSGPTSLYASHWRKSADPQKYEQWRRRVLRQAEYRCESCGTIDVELHADHLLSWARFPESRYDPANGQCLCYACHHLRHQPGKPRDDFLQAGYRIRQGLLRVSQEVRDRVCGNPQTMRKLVHRKEAILKELRTKQYREQGSPAPVRRMAQMSPAEIQAIAKRLGLKAP